MAKPEPKRMTMEQDSMADADIRMGIRGAILPSGSDASGFFRFALITGYVLLLTALYRIADERYKTHQLIGTVFNYICRTAFVPALAANYRPEYDPIISMFALANPRALSRAIIPVKKKNGGRE